MSATPVTSPEVLTRVLEAVRAQQAPAPATIRLVTRVADPSLHAALPAGLLDSLAGAAGPQKADVRPLLQPGALAGLVERDGVAGH